MKTREDLASLRSDFERTAAEEEGSDTAPLLDKAGSYPSIQKTIGAVELGGRVGMGEKGGCLALESESPTCAGELRADTRGGDVGKLWTT